MIPVNFPEANTVIRRPEDLDEHHCADIPGYIFTIAGGYLDGMKAITVAWKPSPEELAQVVAGNPIYVTFIGAIVGHTLQTSFHESITF